MEKGKEGRKRVREGDEDGEGGMKRVREGDEEGEEERGREEERFLETYLP